MARLKRLDATDLLVLNTEGEDHLVVTKQEISNTIKKYVEKEVGDLPELISKKYKDELLKKIDVKISVIEKELSAFIDYKFDQLAEKACDLLISRKFKEEVERRAEEIAEQKINKKNSKGKF